jgi:hypothetical protein
VKTLHDLARFQDCAKIVMRERWQQEEIEYKTVLRGCDLKQPNLSPKGVKGRRLGVDSEYRLSLKRIQGCAESGFRSDDCERGPAHALQLENLKLARYS